MATQPSVRDLEAEIERLQAVLAKRDGEIADRDETLATRDRTLAERDRTLARVIAERDHYHEQLRIALARLYGPRTEKLDPDQLLLFAAEIEDARAQCEDEDSEPLPDRATRPASRRRGRPVRRPLPDTLERVEEIHDLPADERACPCCGEERVIIARDASERLEIEPPRLWVRRDVRLVRACVTCRDQVQRAEKPHAPIEKSIAGSSLLAHLVTSKFEDHLPLHRIEKILKRSGVTLSSSTQSDLLRRTAELLEPLVDRMWQHVRRSPVIHTDDTTMPTLDRGRSKSGRGTRDVLTGRLWPYLGRAGPPGDRTGSYVVFRYTSSRAAKHVADALAEWSGTLQGDCLAAYVAMDRDPESGIALAACWAHARRGFHEARGSDPARALHAMTLIGRLYEVEREIREAVEAAKAANTAPPSPEAIAEVRNEQSRPIVDALMGWIEDELARPEVLPKSAIGRALAYVRTHRAMLERYLDDGRLEIDNSLVERAIRPVAVGRKNFLFAGSERGGRTMATLMSVVGSARLHGVDVAAYLGDVIERIAGHPAGRLGELLPDAWSPRPRPVRATTGEPGATTTLTS